MKNLLKISALVMALGFGSSAMAGSVTGSFQSNAVITSSCLLSASAVAFGAFTPTSTATTLSANGTVSATCSNGVAYALSLDAGTKGTIGTRQMGGANAANADLLAYNIYTTTAKTTIFGNGTTGSKINSTGTGSAQAITVYGGLLTNQYVTPDNYSDTLTVTMTY